MNKYNFDEVIDRSGTNSSKWENDSLLATFGEEDLLPFWVADMDFKTAPEILEDIKERVDHGIFGYSIRQDSYFESIINWTNKRFSWKIKKEWIKFTPGVVPAINYSIQTYCKPGDKVLIQEPVYYPFKNSIINNGCQVVVNELVENNNTYEIDFIDLEDKLKDPRVKIMILCSPHNPVARVWTKEELKKIGKLCIENDVLVLSDEIHNDLLMFGHEHTMFASISKEFENNSITFTAPSKTFNLAGMQASNIIIPNDRLRQMYEETLIRNSISGQNPLSIVALESAYNKGEYWLEELITYLEKNYLFIKEYINNNLPKAKLFDHQGTYLAWLDLRDYDENGKRLEENIISKGKVAFDGGTWFGDSGNGFIRINFACPRPLLKEGLDRLREAIEKSY